MASLSACCEDASIASKLADHAVRGRSHNSHRPGMNQIDACAHTAGGRVVGAHSFLEAAGMEQAQDDKLAPRSACSQALKPSPKPLPLRLFALRLKSDVAGAYFQWHLAPHLQDRILHSNDVFCFPMVPV